MDALPNSGESQQPAALVPASGKVQARQKPPIPNIEEIVKRHRTFAGALRELFETLYPHIPAIAQGPTPEADRARFERIFRPWPKWVLRLGAELWHVDYPTIDRSIFFQTFRVLNTCIFRCPTNPEAKRIPTVRHDAFDRIDFRVLPLITASFFGHSFEHIEAIRKKLDEQLATGKITKESYDSQIKLISREHLENTVSDWFADWSKHKEVSPFELTRAIEDARRKTFDKHGEPKETPLIPIYRVMLHNWITIENMSGPKALTEFLAPHLGNQAFEDKYERVKAICKRTRVRFRPFVKGQ